MTGVRRVMALGWALAVACVADTSPLGEGRDGGFIDVGAVDSGASVPDLGTLDLGAPDLGTPDLGAPGPTVDYPPGCLPVDGYLFCLRPEVFDEARRVCRSVEGDLITIETSAENQRVSEGFERWSPAEFWLGLRDGEREGTWIWIDGRPLEGFNNWNPGEPNDLQGEDCAHNNWRFTGGWNDIDCADRYAYVCEFSPGNGAVCFDDADCVLSFGRCADGSCRASRP